MSEFRVDQITNQSGTAGPDIAGITSFSSTSGMLMPSGTTEYRGGRGRGLFGGQGASPVFSNTIDYITISTLGNAFDFGDLTAVKSGPFGCASSTRGLFGGGYNPTRLNVIDYITISSTGNAFDFGDLLLARQAFASCSNSTRGIWAAGFNPQAPTTPSVTYSQIDYVTISTLGDASKFGDLTRQSIAPVGAASPTRGIFAGGGNIIEYITIATTGNAIDFGDLTYSRQISGNGSIYNSVRSIFGGNPNVTNNLDYITTATLGNAITFGNLSVNRRDFAGTSSSTRGCFGGGGEFFPSAVQLNIIDYVTIMTTGNALDFGDLTLARGRLAGLSDAHGGLGD
jgi:hypothetical protein